MKICRSIITNAVFLGLGIAAMAAPTMARTQSAQHVNPHAGRAEGESFQIDGMRVERYGHQGRAVILIPGLSSGSWVWRDTVKRLKANHVVYTVTLPGFDGVPTPMAAGSLMDAAEADVVKLMDSQHLLHPVLVGHSLGGTLSIRIAEAHPDRIGGVVAVDGLPVFPGTQAMSLEQRQAAGAQMKQQMASMTQQQFAAQQLGYMQRIGLVDQAKAADVAKLSARSDAHAVAAYMAEDFALDLRPGLKSIRAPLLEVSPYNPTDFSSGPMKMSEAEKAGFYWQLLADAPTAQVQSISPARHFVMLDQPQAFQRTLDAFLSALPKDGP